MNLSGDSRASSSPSSTAGGPAQQHYHKFLELEQLLVTTVQSKGPFDPNVQTLRNNIRELFESIILEDHEFAELHEVEQSLWRLHHTRIEEFRARIRKSMASSGTGSAPSMESKSVVRREPVQKILAVFRSFLSEATGFYHDLILKIKAKHGLSQDDLTYGAISTKDSMDDKKRVVELKRCQLSCHRCLIYLGDLARYKEYYGDGDAKTHDWSIAAGFYVKAAYLWPASGNPYNQLAVLATYVGDEMLAVYHYFRSLASETPFLTAKDNLILLFEKNRHNYLQLASSSARKPLQNIADIEGKKKVDLWLADGSATTQKHDDSPHSTLDIMRSFRVHVVRLNGLLFTRMSLETFAEVHSCILSQLEQLLTKGVDDEAGASLISGWTWGTGPNVLFQLIGILIFIVHNANASAGGPDSHQLTYAEILQHSVILEHAFIATFECVGYVLRQCVKTEEPLSSPLLPVVLVVMEWLSCEPEIALGSEMMKGKEGNARMFFWKNCVDCLNKLPRDEEGHVSAKNDDKDGLILWEDHEFRGFIPLRATQLKLAYTKKPTMGLGSQKEKHLRLKRIKQAGRMISSTFQGTRKGIHYDVETGKFYLSTDKTWQEKKQVHVAPIVEVRGKPTSEDHWAASAKFAPSPTEEEDEEVIVFKPSNKPKEHTCAAVLEDAVVKLSLESTHEDTKRIPKVDFALHLSSIEDLLCEALPSNGSMGNVYSTFPEPASTVAVEVHGPLASSNASHGSSWSVPGLVDGDLKTIVSAIEPGHMVGWRNDTGFGTFRKQPYSGSSTLPTFHWQPQDSLIGASLWNSELDEVFPPRGSLGMPLVSTTASMVNNFPFLELSSQYLQNMVPGDPMQTWTESLNVPPLSMANGVRDAIVQASPSFLESKPMMTDNSIGSLQAVTQDLSRMDGIGSKAMLGSGLANDADRRVSSVSSSSIRPPPGFGPLPAKTPVGGTAASGSRSGQPPLFGQTSNTTLVKPKNALGDTIPLQANDQVDDYGWLDGYIAPRKERSHPAAFSQSSVSSYGWLSGGQSQGLETALSPFPGMKPPDCVISLPLLSTSQQQTYLPQSYLQHQLLHDQQRQQMQQLYNAQLAAQQNNQLLHTEQQQDLHPLQRETLGLQQQKQQPVWPGPNSFVS